MLVRAKSSAEIFDTSWFGRYHGVMTDTSKPRGPYAKTAAKRAAVARAAVAKHDPNDAAYRDA